MIFQPKIPSLCLFSDASFNCESMKLEGISIFLTENRLTLSGFFFFSKTTNIFKKRRQNDRLNRFSNKRGTKVSCANPSAEIRIMSTMFTKK